MLHDMKWIENQSEPTKRNIPFSPYQKTPNKTNNKMNIDYLQSFTVDTIRTVAVSFIDLRSNEFGVTESAKTYTYKTRANLASGDLVIAPNNSGESIKYGFAIVVEVHEVVEIEPESTIKYGWIMQKVDTDAYAEALRSDEEWRKHVRAIERKANRKKILAALESDYGDLLEMPKEAVVKDNPDCDDSEDFEPSNR